MTALIGSKADLKKRLKNKGITTVLKGKSHVSLPQATTNDLLNVAIKNNLI